jgi:hypothetical protein
MAIWYTDNLTGNDTTGDGSIALPYKTINKAMTVGANGDEIRVAGSGFTALPGTCSHTSRTGTSWNTSQNLTGLLVPGDIITYNDPNFGDQKFFYKVFSVSPTGFVTDGATNFDENVNVTLSKVTTQHYYTTAASQTFENVTVFGKTQFDIRGGWTNNFTAQNGLTVMNYHSTATATAQSGTGFTAVSGFSGTGMYFDRFMLSHLTTGFAGSVNAWSPGTLAFVYMPTSTAVFGANPIASATYPNKDLYLSNTRLSAFNSPQFAADGTPAVKYDNCWFMRPALTGVSSAPSPIQITNHNIKGYSIGASPSTQGINISSQNIFGNVTVSSFAAVGTVETVTLAETAQTSVIITNSLNRVGQNASNLVYAGPANGVGCLMINAPAQNLENLTGDATTNGWTQMTPNTNTGYFNLKTNTYIKDSEGFKTVFGNGQILFADPTETSTGTNSLRLSKPKGVVSSSNSIVPFESLFIDSTTPKTITIRCKSSTAGTVKFGFYPNAKTGNIVPASATVVWGDEDKTVGTSWTDVTYTGLSAYNANVFLNSFVALGLNTATMPGKYIWIDSVTIS